MHFFEIVTVNILKIPPTSKFPIVTSVFDSLWQIIRSNQRRKESLPIFLQSSWNFKRSKFEYVKVKSTFQTFTYEIFKKVIRFKMFILR